MIIQHEAAACSALGPKLRTGGKDQQFLVFGQLSVLTKIKLIGFYLEAVGLNIFHLKCPGVQFC